MPRSQPQLFEQSFAALSWAYRASQAVGSSRFAETIFRAEFYLQRTQATASTPGEKAIVAGLAVMLDDLIAANARARVVLADSVSGMDAAEACEFVELCESGDDPAV